MMSINPAHSTEGAWWCVITTGNCFKAGKQMIRMSIKGDLSWTAIGYPVKQVTYKDVGCDAYMLCHMHHTSLGRRPFALPMWLFVMSCICVLNMWHYNTDIAYST